MNGAILTSRLNALDGDLARVDESLALVQQLPFTLRVPSELSSRVYTAVQDEIKACRTKLEIARELLAQAQSNGDDGDAALQSAWEEFAELQQTTRALFSACLEFLGGLAFRDDRVQQGTALDEDLIWEFADTLIAESVYAMWGYTQPFLTVPALGETLCDTVVSTVRLRFPEWSVWSLPLGAYEFGHIAIVERPLDEYFKELLKTRDRAAAAVDIRRGRWRFARSSPENRLRVLVADAFATLHLGLSYGAAALHLRLDPIAAHSGTPTHDERAAVIIAALKTLATEYGLDANILTDRIKQLENDWDDAVKRAAPAPAPDGQHVPVEDLLSSLTEDLRDALSSTVLYGKERWQFARSIADAWLDAPVHRRPFETTPQPAYTLRDILNAAWLSRLVNPALEPKLGDASLGMASRYLKGDFPQERSQGTAPAVGRSVAGRLSGGGR